MKNDKDMEELKRLLVEQNTIIHNLIVTTVQIGAQVGKGYDHGTASYVFDLYQEWNEYLDELEEIKKKLIK